MPLTYIPTYASVMNIRLKLYGKIKMTTVRNRFPDTSDISHCWSGSFFQKHVLMLKGYLGMYKYVVMGRKTMIHQVKSLNQVI